MSQNDFWNSSSSPSGSNTNSPSSHGFANFQNQPGGFTALLSGNSNIQPPNRPPFMTDYQQFQFWQWQQQQQAFQQSQVSESIPVQPSQPREPEKASSSRKRKGKGVAVVEDVEKSGKIAWSQAQERALAENWVHVSECRRTGNSQTGDSFWYRVLALYNKNLAKPFTKNQLTGKWTAMSKNIRSFIACHDRAERDRGSGDDDKSVYTTALKFYEAENGQRAFRHHSAWEVLSKSPKFRNPKPVDEPIDLDDDGLEIFGHDEIPRPAGKPRPPKQARSSSSSDVSSKHEEFNASVVEELRALRLAKTREIEEKRRFRKMEFLRTPTHDMEPEDRAEIERQKAIIRAEFARERNE